MDNKLAYQQKHTLLYTSISPQGVPVFRTLHDLDTSPPLSSNSRSRDAAQVEAEANNCHILNIH